TPLLPATFSLSPMLLCFVVILCWLRRNSLPPDPADPGEIPYGTNKLGLTFCHIKRPNVQIVAYSLPKNLARFFVRTCGHFACFSGSHGRFYMAKRQGYGSFPLLVIVRRDIQYTVHAHRVREEKRCPHARASHACTTLVRTRWPRQAAP